MAYRKDHLAQPWIVSLRILIVDREYFLFERKSVYSVSFVQVESDYEHALW